MQLCPGQQALVSNCADHQHGVQWLVSGHHGQGMSGQQVATFVQQHTLCQSLRALRHMKQNEERT
jgi:hypothetical protein